MIDVLCGYLGHFRPSQVQRSKKKIVNVRMLYNLVYVWLE